MPNPPSRQKPKTEPILLMILGIKEPPVARCRLLSRGLEPYHRLGAIGLEAAGDKGCIACGNCVDSCPVLRREPDRFSKTDQRTSMAMEAIVAEDCEQSKKIRTLLDHYLLIPVDLLIGILLGIFIAR